MKLIDEKEVKGESINYQLCCDMDMLQQMEDNGESDFNEFIDEAFRHGVSFAEQKLLPMMVEFAEWLDDNMWTQYESEDKQYINVGKWYNTTSF